MDTSASCDIDKARISFLRDCAPRLPAQYVLLWVQQDKRESCNHALEFAVQEANKLNLPLLALFGLCEHFPDANARSFRFMLEGLCDTLEDFARRGIRFVCKRGNVTDVVCHFAVAASCIITDVGYLRICRSWRNEIAQRLPDMRFVQVESNVVVPVKVASTTREPAAATLRPKIERLLSRFLRPLARTDLKCKASDLHLFPELEQDLLDMRDPEKVLQQLDVDRAVPPVDKVGGPRAAERAFTAFSRYLPEYGVGKANDPSIQHNSFLSPYLHFGQVSPLELSLKVKDAASSVLVGPKPMSNANAFLEELIIRRELARNFCFYCDNYDRFDCLPDWAKASLIQHQKDTRTILYDRRQLERGETDDPWWNAAQWEMVASGHMHNYMRMYWCKQLIVWIADPQEAFNLAVTLNNKYSLDGRDENGYMGIAWCFGHHDREFPERPLFGTIRPMTRKGIESKFNMPKYKHLVQQKCRHAVAREPRVAHLLSSAALGGADGASSLLRFCLPQSDSPVPCARSDMPAPSSKQSTSIAKPNPSAPSKDSKPPEAKQIPPKDQHGLHRFFKASSTTTCTRNELQDTKRQKLSSEGIVTVD